MNRKHLEQLKNGDAGDYDKYLIMLLMGDKEYPYCGYRPIDIEKRIKDLLEIEQKYKELSK